MSNAKCDNCGKELVGFDASAYENLEVFCSLKCNQDYQDESNADYLVEDMRDNL